MIRLLTATYESSGSGLNCTGRAIFQDSGGNEGFHHTSPSESNERVETSEFLVALDATPTAGGPARFKFSAIAMVPTIRMYIALNDPGIHKRFRLTHRQITRTT
jgi:hypothetical protein